MPTSQLPNSPGHAAVQRLRPASSKSFITPALKTGPLHRGDSPSHRSAAHGRSRCAPWAVVVVVVAAAGEALAEAGSAAGEALVAAVWRRPQLRRHGPYRRREPRIRRKWVYRAPAAWAHIGGVSRGFGGMGIAPRRRIRGVALSAAPTSAVAAAMAVRSFGGRVAGRIVYRFPRRHWRGSLMAARSMARPPIASPQPGPRTAAVGAPASGRPCSHWQHRPRRQTSRAARTRSFGQRAISNAAWQSHFGWARFHGRFCCSLWPWWSSGIVIGWFGPLFWPYAYYDFFDYVFWPYAYDDFWPYAYKRHLLRHLRTLRLLRLCPRPIPALAPA